MCFIQCLLYRITITILRDIKNVTQVDDFSYYIFISYLIGYMSYSFAHMIKNLFLKFPTVLLNKILLQVLLVKYLVVSISLLLPMYRIKTNFDTILSKKILMF